MNNKNIFSTLKTIIISSLILLVPLFFLPFTQDFFVLNKLYMLAFGILALLFVSTIELLVTKKFVWQQKSFDGLVIMFIISTALSTIINSPNKIQALLNPNFGLVTAIILGFFYYYVSRMNESSKKINMTMLSISSVILSLITIIYIVVPFKNLPLPVFFTFLKNPSFSPIGNTLDLIVLLGFFTIFGTFRLVVKKESVENNQATLIFNIASLTINTVAFLLTLYFLIQSSIINHQSSIILPPFNISWFAAVEILKTPLTALFGVGVNNFSSLFTLVKNAAYNQTSLWQINAFNVSASSVLHIISETGVLGGATIILIIINMIKKLLSIRKLNKNEQIPYVPFTITTFLFILAFITLPPSFMLFFVFFYILAEISNDSKLVNTEPKKSFEIGGILPLYLGSLILSLVFIVSGGYLLGKSYLAEYYFKQSLDGFTQNNVKTVYDNQRSAIIINPYIERFHTNFAQTNLLIANNIASKATPKDQSTNNQDTKQPNSQLSEQDRQTITQAIQTSIAEAKAAVSLNQQNASNWENLAVIYRNVINVAQGADSWTISAYQRAIVLDPQNPMYRLSLGGVYYSLKDYSNAQNLFNQSVGLKPDWANGSYNLAWASFQKGDYQLAVNAMQNAINLLDPKTSKEDITRAQKELEE
ncbi:MAG: hypothetical protein Q7R95_02485, partial [bacterium]|nr:hypothetical protein [bacterium]